MAPLVISGIDFQHKWLMNRLDHLLASGVSVAKGPCGTVAVVVVAPSGADGHHAAGVGHTGVLLALAAVVDALVVVAAIVIHL